MLGTNSRTRGTISHHGRYDTQDTVCSMANYPKVIANNVANFAHFDDVDGKQQEFYKWRYFKWEAVLEPFGILE